MATVLVTGANRGIGLELCHHLADRGDDVIAVCRTSDSWLEQPGITVVDGIDVGDDAVVEELGKRLREPVRERLHQDGAVIVALTLVFRSELGRPDARRRGAAAAAVARPPGASLRSASASP